MGNTLITIGIILVIAGLGYKAGLLNWFGNLPGDLKFEGENSKVFFPITTMIVISVLLSVIFSFLRK